MLWKCERCPRLTEVGNRLCEFCREGTCTECEGTGTVCEPDVTLSVWVDEACAHCGGTGLAQGVPPSERPPKGA